MDSQTVYSLDFTSVDDIGLAGEKGRLRDGVMPRRFLASALGPYIELLWLDRRGLIPSPINSYWLETGELGAFARALTGASNKWTCRQTGAIGFLRASTSLSHTNWTAFAMDAKRAALASGLNTDWAAQIVAALVEMFNNVYEHSGASETGIAAFRTTSEVFEFVIADGGRGLLNSLKSSPFFPEISDHGEALQLTLTDGMSRHGVNIGRGFGFRPLFSGLANRNANLRFRTGDKALTIDGTSPDLLRAKVSPKPFVQGFIASVSCMIGHRGDHAG